MKVHTKLWVSVILCVGLLMSITCISFAQTELILGGQYNLEEYEELTGKKIEKFDEAPSLRVRVATGELPPTEERLPGNPAVVEPVEEIGQYGGTWHRYEPDAWTIPALIAYEPLIRWAPDAKSIEPNIAKDWGVAEDGKSITLFLRKGIKWSDGYPFTIDDIMFNYEDILLNNELTPVKPSQFVIGGELCKFEKLDDYTLRISFVEPHALFIYQLAGNYPSTYVPKHYLKQFHPKYTSVETLESRLEEANLENWYELLQAKSDVSANPDLPVLHAWVAEKAWGPYLVKAQRNPYYWKIDPDGNQLPYIDELSIGYTTDWNSAFLKVTTGQSEMQGVGHSFTDYPLYMENREKGDYRVFEWPTSTPSQSTLMLNQNHKDPVLRQIFGDARFRQALSLATNREEINEMVFLGLCPISQATITPESPLFKEEFGKAYVEYDPDRANRLLDEMGLKWDKEHGWRLRSDGKRLEIVLLLREEAIWVSSAEIIKKQYEEIGVQIINQTVETSLWVTRIDASELDATVQPCGDAPLLLRGSTFVLTSYFSVWFKEWAKWRDSNGETGEKPAKEMLKILELYEKYKVTTNEQERTQIGREIFEIHAENVWLIGLGGRMVPYLYIVKNNFRNFPESWSILSGQPSAHPEQFWIEE